MWAGNISVRSQTHRLYADGQLFSMTTDLGQTSPVNATEPTAATALATSVKTWREEMFGGAGPGSGKNRGGNTVDPRPFPVGYREFPITMLPARDGEPIGGVKRNSSAPNSSYFVNWKHPDDRIVCRVDGDTAGLYQVSIDYTCPVADAGSTLEFACKEARLTGPVTPDLGAAALYTLPRPKGESPMKQFRTLNLGAVTFPPARDRSPSARP